LSTVNTKSKKGQAYTDLEKALKTVKSSFVTVGVYSFFINILMLAGPIYMLAVYDIVMPAQGLDTLFVVTMVILVFFIGGAVLEYVRARVLIHIAQDIDAVLNQRIFNAAFDMASRYPGKSGSGPLRDFNTIKTFLSGQAVFALFDAPWFPIYIGLMFMFDSVYGFYGIAATLVIFLLTYLNEKATKKGLEHSTNMFQRSLGHFDNAARNIEVVEAMGMRRPLFRKWMEKHYEFVKVHAEASGTAAGYSNASKSFRMMSSSLMYGVGAILAINGSISPGMIIAGAVLLGRALQPISQLVGTWKSFVSARQAYNKLHNLLEEFPEEEEKISLPEPKGLITMENVVVAPPLSQTPVLKGINLRIEPGLTVGVIGPSAAGKSSIAKTIVGVWRTAAGHVRIDGAEISQYNRDELGRHIGYLPQDIELFEGTIAENIARFRDDDPAKIIEAAKISGTHDLIVHLPDGYDTKVGPGGMNLSGGQKQRIGLARAVYDNPKIIVLDEPNSNLDEAGEYALMMALRVLKQKGSTIVFITHKRNILALADTIAYVMEGQVKMYGPRDDVLKALSKGAETAKVEKRAPSGESGAKSEKSVENAGEVK
jgi:ATP-binding cassette subfamily C protein EexD